MRRTYAHTHALSLTLNIFIRLLSALENFTQPIFICYWIISNRNGLCGAARGPADASIQYVILNNFVYTKWKCVTKRKTEIILNWYRRNAAWQWRMGCTKRTECILHTVYTKIESRKRGTSIINCDLNSIDNYCELWLMRLMSSFVLWTMWWRELHQKNRIYILYRFTSSIWMRANAKKAEFFFLLQAHKSSSIVCFSAHTSVQSFVFNAVLVIGLLASSTLEG